MICAVLGASLAVAIEDTKRRLCQANAVIGSLQVAIRSLQEQLKENKQLLEEERNLYSALKEELGSQFLREADAVAEVVSPLVGLAEGKGNCRKLPSRVSTG